MRHVCVCNAARCPIARGKNRPRAPVPSSMRPMNNWSDVKMSLLIINYIFGCCSAVRARARACDARCSMRRRVRTHTHTHAHAHRHYHRTNRELRTRCRSRGAVIVCARSLIIDPPDQLSDLITCNYAHPSVREAHARVFSACEHRMERVYIN